MPRKLLALVLVATLVGVAGAHLRLPLPEENPRPVEVPRPVSAGAQHVAPDGGTAGNAGAPEARQAPVPLVRSSRTTYEPPKPKEAQAPDPEAQAQDELDRKAAKAAIEADGYKRVTILSKRGNGSWRAKAYRGNTEVQLTVDSSGGVSAD